MIFLFYKVVSFLSFKLKKCRLHFYLQIIFFSERDLKKKEYLFEKYRVIFASQKYPRDSDLRLLCELKTWRNVWDRLVSTLDEKVAIVFWLQFRLDFKAYWCLVVLALSIAASQLFLLSARPIVSTLYRSQESKVERKRSTAQRRKAKTVL